MALLRANQFRRLFAAFTVSLVLAFSILPASAAAAAGKCSQPNFFGLETWYAYLPYKYDSSTQRCEVQISQGQILGKNSAILLIILAVIDDLLRIAGIVAVIFVIIGGFKFITSNGEPEQAASARNTIIYALIGLVIALIAVVVVSFIGHSLGV